jgi:hypothetical protein
LTLNVGAQPIGVDLLRIGRPNEIENRQRVAQVSGGRERTCARQRDLAAARQRERLFAHDGRRGIRLGDILERLQRLQQLQRSPRSAREIGPRLDRVAAGGQRCGHDHERGHNRSRSTRFRGRRVGLARPGRRRRGGSRGRCFETIQPLEESQRFVRGRAAVYCGSEQPPRFAALAAMERRDAGLQQLFRLTLALGNGAAGPLDVRARARMTAIEEERARPHVDRLVVLRREVVIEADEQEMFDFRVAIRVHSRLVRVSGVAAVSVRHVERARL